MRSFMVSVPDRQAIHRRFLAFGPVLLLHAAILIALLHMHLSAFNGSTAPEHEIILFLKPVPSVPTIQGDLLPPVESAESALPRLVVPAIRTRERPTVDTPSAEISEEHTSEMQAVSRTLFRCWTNGPGGLMPVTDTQCLTFAPDHAFNFLSTPERSLNADQWLRDRERRNAPLLAPCWGGLSFATVSCVAKGLVNGFDLENQPSYADYDHKVHMTGADAVRRQMETVDPCAIDRTAGPGFVCLDRVVNGNISP